MKKILTILIFLFSVGICAAQESKGVKFLDISFEQAFEKAKKEGKLVFVNYTTKGCSPCKMMEKSVYTDASLAKKMNENFVCIKQDPIKDKNLEKRARGEHGIKGFPTMIFFKAEGDMLSKDAGFKSVEQINQLIDNSLKLK